tara:strand:+ start:165 stop:323 length:159 start_codon:yes stop_codon:yes gene_type:complete
MIKNKEKLKIICAWCNKLIQDGCTSLLMGKERVSHGICEECSDKMSEENKGK